MRALPPGLSLRVHRPLALLTVALAGVFSGCGRDWAFSGGACEPDQVAAAPTDERCGGYTGEHLWSLQVAGAGAQRALAVAPDPVGNAVLVTGDFEDITDLGDEQHTSAGSADIFLAKLDATDGSPLFSLALGSSGDDRGNGVAVDPEGNIHVVGSIAGPVDFGGGTLDPGPSHDAFVVKLGPDGEHIWSMLLGDDADPQVAYGVAVDEAGRVAVTGRFQGTLQAPGGPALNSAGGDDIFIVVLEPDGSHAYSKGFGSFDFQVGEQVVFDPLGSLLVAGTAYGLVDIDGEVVGAFDQVTGFLVKLDRSGNLVWSKTLGATEDYAFGSVAVDPAGNVVASTSFQGMVDVGGGPYTSTAGKLDALVVKLSPDGQHLWSRAFGGVEEERVHATIDAQGHITVAAIFEGTVDLGSGPLQSVGASTDVLVARWSETGNLLHARSFGASMNESSKAIASVPDGGVVLAGTFNGAVSWGGDTFVSQGGSNGFVARYAR